MNDKVLDCHLDGIATRVTGDVVIRLTIPVEHFAKLTPLLSKVGHDLKVAFIDPVGKCAEIPPRYGQQARALKQSSFFRTPAVWEKVGTDKQYLNWIRHQESCVSGDQDDFADGGQRGCEAAHVRRIASGAGTGIKPPYSAVPLTHAEHTSQHAKGERDFLVDVGVLDAQPHEQIRGLDNAAKRWFDEQRIKHVEQWCWETLKAALGYEHWNEVPPYILTAWASDNGVEKYLPGEYPREAA